MDLPPLLSEVLWVQLLPVEWGWSWDSGTFPCPDSSLAVSKSAPNFLESHLKTFLFSVSARGLGQLGVWRGERPCFHWPLSHWWFVLCASLRLASWWDQLGVGLRFSWFSQPVFWDTNRVMLSMWALLIMLSVVPSGKRDLWASLFFNECPDPEGFPSKSVWRTILAPGPC